MHVPGQNYTPHMYWWELFYALHAFKFSPIYPVPRILLVDDNPIFRSAMKRALEDMGVVTFVDTATNGREALDLTRNGCFDLMILDLVMPDVGGLEVLEDLRKEKDTIDVLVLTGHGSIESAAKAFKLGANDYIEKAADTAALTSVIEKILTSRHLTPHVLAHRMDSFIIENLSDSSLSVEVLRRHFRISPGYVSRLFKQHLGTSFRKRLNFHRIRRSKSLLAETDYQVAEIASMCGYKNWRRLSEAFKAQEAISPRRYRQISSDLRRDSDVS